MLCVAIQWFNVLTKIRWQLMPSVVTHCHIGGKTSLLPTTQGDDVKCCRGHVALHLCSWLDISGLSVIHWVSELSRHRLYLEIHYTWIYITLWFRKVKEIFGSLNRIFKTMNNEQTFGYFVHIAWSFMGILNDFSVHLSTYFFVCSQKLNLSCRL